MVSGSSAEITAIEKAPRTSWSMERVAWTSEAPPAMWCSMRWTITSVSVSDAMTCPSASKRAEISAWFSMIPLWMIAMRPVQSTCGWAFSAVGLPCVAQRVCPIAAP